MILATRDFGDIEVNDKDIIKFVSGIKAFEELHSFILLSPLGEKYPMWLQCTEKKEPCFIVYNPCDITEYKPNLSESDKKLLNSENDDELSYLVIAVIPEDYKKSTVNLKSPIVINKKNNLAMQVILDDDYKLRYPLFKEGGIN